MPSGADPSARDVTRILAEDDRHFEGICRELLEAIGFHSVRHVGGPGDRGLDLVAERLATSPLEQTQSERWIVQCKHTPARSVSRSEVATQAASVVDPNVDVYCLMTTGRLSAPAKQFVDEYNRTQRRFRFDYLEGGDLVDLLARHMPDALAGSAVDHIAHLVRRAEDAWMAALPLDAARVARSAIGDHMEPSLSRAYLRQHHEVKYLTNGSTLTWLTLTLVNLGRRGVEDDVLTFHGDQYADNKGLDLAVMQTRPAFANALSHQVRFDTGDSKVISVTLADTLAPAAFADFTVRVAWPYKAPLLGRRYYEVFTNKMTFQHTFAITVPSAVRPGEALVTRVADDETTLDSIAFAPLENAWVARGVIFGPRVGDRHRISFDLHADESG